jgi:hypothetical protein
VTYGEGNDSEWLPIAVRSTAAVIDMNIKRRDEGCMMI